MNDIFGGFNSSYELKDVDEKTIDSYKKAMKIFKKNYPKSIATLSIDLQENTNITFKNFKGEDMFYLGYSLALVEHKENNNNG